MRTLLAVLLIGLPLNFVYADEACQTWITEHYSNTPAVKLGPDRQIQVWLEESFWSGTKSLNISTDGQLYLSFKRPSLDSQLPPILFKSNGRGGNNFAVGVRNLKKKFVEIISQAKAQGLWIQLDPEVIKATSDNSGVCSIDGDSILGVLSLEDSSKPQPEPDTLGDRSADLPEGQLPKGRVLEGDGDRS